MSGTKICFKEGVRFKEYSRALGWIFFCLVDISNNPDESTPEEIWITSVNDSEHLPNSRHYLNEAIDVRSKNFASREFKIRFIARLSAILNSHPIAPHSFVIIFENENQPNEHFHIQVKKGLHF